MPYKDKETRKKYLEANKIRIAERARKWRELNADILFNKRKDGE